MIGVYFIVGVVLCAFGHPVAGGVLIVVALLGGLS